MNDEIFLLSIEEYEKYKNVIPKINCWWWLRSPGYSSTNAAYVYRDGSVNDVGGNIRYDGVAVCPAIKFNPLLSLKPGDRFIKHDFPWIYLGDCLAISEVPIAFRRFDKEGNDYDTSEVRKFLFEWKRSRLIDIRPGDECVYPNLKNRPFIVSRVYFEGDTGFFDGVFEDDGTVIEDGTLVIIKKTGKRFRIEECTE